MKQEATTVEDYYHNRPARICYIEKRGEFYEVITITKGVGERYYRVSMLGRKPEECHADDVLYCETETTEQPLAEWLKIHDETVQRLTRDCDEWRELAEWRGRAIAPFIAEFDEQVQAAAKVDPDTAMDMWFANLTIGDVAALCETISSPKGMTHGRTNI